MKDIPFKSVPDMLRRNASKFAEKPALRYRKQGEFTSLSYAEFYERAQMVARGLLKHNLKAGDRIAILSENRVDWVIADMGILMTGCVTVPVYATNTPAQVRHVLNHSEARIVFVSTSAQYAKLLSSRDALNSLELVVSFDCFPGENILPLFTVDQLLEADCPVTESDKERLEACIECIGHGDLMTVIYTSGTTGVPKGAMLSHGNILCNAFYTYRKVRVLSEGEVHLSFLPLSHGLERTVGYYMLIMNGGMMAFADSIDKVSENMLEVRPTVMVSVPRLFEKIYSRIFDAVNQMPAAKQKLFHWALDVGRRYVEARFITRRIPAFLGFKHKVADLLIFNKLRKRFGGNLKLFCCGGAPLDKTINEFFWIIGLPILEGYGLTETSPVVCFNTLEHVRLGSVGTTIEYTEIKTDTDGELLVKGPQVLMGYYKDDAATGESLQDGWFRTGDIARIYDGFIYIVDRKKELIITAGGKNIAPQPIENKLKLDEYISQAFVFGDRKAYLTALLVPDFDRLTVYAFQKKIDYRDVEDLVMSEHALNLMWERIQMINNGLARYESIKKFVLLPRELSVDGGELTPTLKLKRKVIYDKYKDKIEGMYYK